jgi:DNA (cytosine-5)-methyltransferase 1
MDRPRAIELFGCSGGMAEGFRRAGIEFAQSFDADPVACESYARNLGHPPVQLDVRALLGIARLTLPGSRIDLLVADPPCTPWSRAGKRRGLEDERDMLSVTAQLIEAWRPCCWLIGNVPGLDDASNTFALQRTLGTLAAHYCIDFASLDAAAYGVPQHRVRPFWFGHPRGTPCLAWPQPTHGAVGAQLQIAGIALEPYVTVRQALAHLPARALGKRVRVKWHARHSRHGHPLSEPDRPAGTILAGMPIKCGNVLASSGRIDHRLSEPDRPARTLTRNTHSDGALLAHPKHPINELDKPSHTVTAKDRGGAQGAHAMHWPSARHAGANAIKLSERAAAILQGFPETWHFAGDTKRARWSQIGQAMPPALAAAVAQSVVRWFASRSSVACAGE